LSISTEKDERTPWTVARVGVEKVVDLGTICTIRFKYQGSDFNFEAHPQGRWHDVAAVMNGFDAFMQSIGRDDRCYELEGGGEFALLVVAPAPRFGPLATRLGIPLERDPVSARDSAKAYQRQTKHVTANAEILQDLRAQTDLAIGACTASVPLSPCREHASGTPRQSHAKRVVTPLATPRACDQCLASRTTTAPVGSGACGARLVRVASVQLATLTILHA
jgi:hypothetical protein